MTSRLAEIEAEFLAGGGKFLEKRVGDIFQISTPKRRFDANKIQFGGKYPYVARGESNNGIRGYITEDTQYLNKGNTISFGQDTATMFYQAQPYFTGDKIKVFSLHSGSLNRYTAQYLITSLRTAFSLFSWGATMFNVKNLQNTMMSIPYQNNEIAFAHMEQVMQELHAERVQELHAFLKVSNLIDVNLSKDEQTALQSVGWVENPTPAAPENSGSLKWKTFNLKDLFGTSTRGKRLKSADRISGNLPFVTAGEADTGISAFIGNTVETFPANTVTIDMFGSAKYRNYAYGADDHVAIVHSQDWDKHAVLFLTSAIHKVANAGQFSYSRNFYAKDADELNILLPEKNGKPDTELMSQIGRAIEKLVIADVAAYAEREHAAYQQTVQA